MAENLGKWRSKREPISKFGLSNGGKAGTAPLALGLWYDFHEYEWHLGNVGLCTISHVSPGTVIGRNHRGNPG